MKSNFKTYVKILVGVALTIYFFQVILPDLTAGFKAGWNAAKNERNK
jgi:hypothetical protein